MNKKQFVLILAIAVVLVWALDLLIGNYLSARLATSSFARKFNLFNPQAPIVVTNRETVRVNSNNDIVQTAQNSKSKVATIVYFEEGNLITSASAVNWTRDGYFISVKDAFATPGKVYAVMTQQGDVYPIEKTYPDPASNLVIIETAANNLPVLDPADLNDIRVGEQIVSISNSLGNGETKFTTGFISRVPSDQSELISESDLISRAVYLQIPDTATKGSAVLNLSGRLVGILDGNRTILSSDVQTLVNNFLANEKNIVRPSLGFSYQMLTETEAKALQTVPGARVVGFGTGKPASLSGIKGGDVIVEIDKQKVESSRSLDTQLRQFKPNETVAVVLNRAGSTLTVNLTITELK